MISSEDERKKALAERLLHSLRNVLASFRDLLKILGALLADGHFFRLFYFEVTNVLDGVAKLLDGGLQACASQGRWTHIHATAALAEVHGYADNANFLGHISIP